MKGPLQENMEPSRLPIAFACGWQRTGRTGAMENFVEGLKTVLRCTSHECLLRFHFCCCSFWLPPAVRVGNSRERASYSSGSSNRVFSNRRGPSE